MVTDCDLTGSYLVWCLWYCCELAYRDLGWGLGVDFGRCSGVVFGVDPCGGLCGYPAFDGVLTLCLSAAVVMSRRRSSVPWFVGAVVVIVIVIVVFVVLTD